MRRGEENGYLAASSSGHSKNINFRLCPLKLSLLSAGCLYAAAVVPSGPLLRLAASRLLLATSKLSGTCRDISTLHLRRPRFRLPPLRSCIRMCVCVQPPRQSTYGNSAAPLSLVRSVSRPGRLHYFLRSAPPCGSP